MSSHAQDVQRYIDGVLDGSIVTGRLERLAVHRHVADLELAGDRGFYFDAKIAEQCIEFSKLCRQFQSPFRGQPLTLRIDQKFFVWCLMGWRRKSDGLRRFEHAQYEVARKAGKSTIAAYLSCLLSYADTPLEYGAQGYVCATKQEQAKIVWEAAMKMIRLSPALNKRAKIKESDLVIEFPQTDGVFRPLASDKTPDGFNPHFIIMDEEHAYREKHREQIETMNSGFGTRAQPLTITITTYGDDESLIWKESHDYAVECLESVITGEIKNDTWFALIFAIDYYRQDEQQQEKLRPCFKCKGDDCPWCSGTGHIPCDDPFDERVWRKANPGIGPGVGHTPQLEKVRSRALLAKQRPDKRPEFMQKIVNTIVSSHNKLITAEAWQACKGELSDWHTATRIHGAFDLARVNDMAGAAVIARFDMVDDSGADFYRFEIRSQAWTCEDRHEAIRTDQVARWIHDGILAESTGNQILFTDVEDWAVRMSDEWNVATWAYDPEFGLILAQRIQEIHGRTIFKFTQSPHFYTGPVGKLADIINEVHTVDGKPMRALVHDGNPVLAWMMTNLTVHKNYRGQRMPDKSSDANKIDLAVAVLMALSECLFSEETGRSVYTRRGLLFIGDDETPVQREGYFNNA